MGVTDRDDVSCLNVSWLFDLDERARAQAEVLQEVLAFFKEDHKETLSSELARIFKVVFFGQSVVYVYDSTGFFVRNSEEGATVPSLGANKACSIDGDIVSLFEDLMFCYLDTFEEELRRTEDFAV